MLFRSTVGFVSFISWSGLDIGRDRASPVSHYEAPFAFNGLLRKVTMTMDDDQELVDKLIIRHLGEMERCILRRDQIGRQRMEYIRMVLKQPRGPGDGPTPDYVGVSWSRTWNKVLGVGRIKACPTSHDTAAKLYTTS